MMADEDNLHQRSTSDPAFYEWLLSDHPAVRAERDYRRAVSYQYQRDQTAAVLTWVAKINAHADPPQTVRDLADSLGAASARISAARRDRPRRAGRPVHGPVPRRARNPHAGLRPA